MLIPTPQILLLQDPQYVSFGEKQEFLAIFFDIHAGIFGKEDSVAHFDFERYASAVIEHFAGADSNDFAFLRFFCAVSGSRMPPLVFVSSVSTLTRTRSANGFNISIPPLDY